MKYLRFLPLLVIALGLGRAVLAEQGTGWSPVVYPEQRLPLAFSHAKHLARGSTCTTCHASATTSRSAVDNLIPTEAACRACHPIDRADVTKTVAGAPPAACIACHPSFV
ncbi:MAG: cytochrome c3 family protein, partial [Polyangiales bacterium]